LNTGDEQKSISELLTTFNMDLYGISSEVREVLFDDLFGSEVNYSQFKQKSDSLYSLVFGLDKDSSLLSIANQTKEGFEWFLTNVPDGYIVDENGHQIVDADLFALSEVNPSGHRMTFTDAGLELFNSKIIVYGVRGNDTIIEGGRITTNEIFNKDRSSWINLGEGTFSYGNGKFYWNKNVLYVDGNGKFEGEVSAKSGYIGIPGLGFRIKDNHIVYGRTDDTLIYHAQDTECYGIYLGTDGLCVSGGTAPTTCYITPQLFRVGDSIIYDGTSL
jgi:hypothetical protein